MTKNIFLTLNRYHGAEENFLTEAFVYLLNQILEKEVSIGKYFLQKLIGIEDNLFSDDFEVLVTTQLTLKEGRPDICIQTSQDALFLIEVKHDSPLSTGQLEAYYSARQNFKKSITKLILLTRSKQTAIETTLSRDKFRQVCWYEIFNWLSAIQTKNEIINFLINDFLQFLEEKAMNLSRVEWEYPAGIKSLLNLTNMLEAAVEEVYVPKIRKSGGWNWRGFYVDSIFCGIRYEKPNLIVFENNYGNNPTFQLVFDIEKEHFLAYSKEEQFESLIKFVSTSAEKYHESGITDTPQSSEIPEDS